MNMTQCTLIDTHTATRTPTHAAIFPVERQPPRHEGMAGKDTAKEEFNIFVAKTGQWARPATGTDKYMLENGRVIDLPITPVNAFSNPDAERNARRLAGDGSDARKVETARLMLEVTATSDFLPCPKKAGQKISWQHQHDCKRCDNQHEKCLRHFFDILGHPEKSATDEYDFPACLSQPGQVATIPSPAPEPAAPPASSSAGRAAIDKLAAFGASVTLISETDLKMTGTKQLPQDVVAQCVAIARNNKPAIIAELTR